MNQITRIKLDKYCKIINEIDPLLKMQITKEKESYYLHMDKPYFNKRFNFKWWVRRSKIPIENPIGCVNHLQLIYENVQ